MFFAAERLVDLLRERDADGFLAFTAPNIFYLTGFSKGGGAAALVHRERPDRPNLVAPSSNLDFLIQGVPDRVDVAAYGRFVRAFGDEESWDPNERRVAEAHHAAALDGSLASILRELLSDFRGVLLCDASDPAARQASEAATAVEFRYEPEAFKLLRSVKTPEEVRRLREGARVTEDAIDDVAGALSEGVSQDELTRTFCASLADSGAGLRLAHISIGRAGAFGNANIPDTRLGVGDVVKLDVGAVVGGYSSDMARCFSLGPPSETTATYYGALLEGQSAALDLIRPGVRAGDVFDRAVSTVRAKGIPDYDRTNVGHGIGVNGDGYDPPLLAPGDDSRLEEGMVLCVETPYYEIGFGGLQVEDMVVVTADGFDPLTRSSRELRTVGE